MISKASESAVEPTHVLLAEQEETVKPALGAATKDDHDYQRTVQSVCHGISEFAM